MANQIAIHRAKAPIAAPAVSRDWEPMHAIRDLMGWDPFGELAPAWLFGGEVAFAPAFEVKETSNAFLFTADLPGVAERDIDVQLTDNRLNVSGRRDSEKTERGDTYYATERAYGTFTRSFTLPDGVERDKLRAELKDGVLRITAPKRPEAQPRKISVASK
jgi:HSP20 family protein